MKVYIDGAENIRWAIDSNRSNLRAALKRLDIDETDSLLRADVVHNVMWDQLFGNRRCRRVWRALSALRKNVLVSAMSFIDLRDPKFFGMDLFRSVNAVARLWIAPSRRQLKMFEEHAVPAAYLPLLVDTRLFRPLRETRSKQELCAKYGIPYGALQGKTVIGSFQRDSLGSDLTAPKWQKGADVLIDLIQGLPRDKYVLLLASPRRHYLIKACKKYGLPYYYFGKETDEDDLILNNQEHAVIAELYNLLDLYLIASRLEGGPTAVIEAAATRTPVFSTDVGLAPDYLERECVFGDLEAYKKALLDFVVNDRAQAAPTKEIVRKQYDRCLSLSADDAIDRRLGDIYRQIAN